MLTSKRSSPAQELVRTAAHSVRSEFHADTMTSFSSAPLTRIKTDAAHPFRRLFKCRTKMHEDADYAPRATNKMATMSIPSPAQKSAGLGKEVPFTE